MDRNVITIAIEWRQENLIAVFWISIGIVIIAAAVGLVAGVADVISRRESSHKFYGPYEKHIKRPLDAFLAAGALIIFSPILLITAILVRMKLGSPVFFAQDRPGKDEKIFRLYKFRTMTDERDEKGELLPDEIRLTKFGKSLRSSSLDELPELLNIIKGDMAVVGPRPLLVKYLPYYTAEQHKRHAVRPGLTGYAQVHGRNLVDWDDKFSMDVEYVAHITFIGDMKIILETVGKVFKREGINSETAATMEDFTDYCNAKTMEEMNQR